MKTSLVSLMICLMATVLLNVPGLCQAQNIILKQECERKAEEAANLIKTLGAQAAFRRIVDPDGPFVGENTHVFCINTETGMLLAHKFAQFVGFNMHHYQDAGQNAPYTRILQLAQTTPNGWVTYTTYGAGPERRTTPGLKNMYYLKVPGEAIVLCCGYWEDA